MKTGIQQFMLGSVMNTQAQARETLAAVKPPGMTASSCALL